MENGVRKSDLRSNSFESFSRAKQENVVRNRRASISAYPERARSPSICLSDDSWVYSPQHKVEWVDESRVKECQGCSKPFNVILRKHHCRNCGDVFCGTCSSFKILLPSYNDRQRVCLHCVTSLVSDSVPPPRSPHAPGAPTELAVNTSLPDDLDDLFDEILENDEDYQAQPVAKPRRVVSSVSRPPRKLFSSVLPVPVEQDEMTPESEHSTTVRFGTDKFAKTISALAVISESQLNAKLPADEDPSQKAMRSTRPPRKSFNMSSPLKERAKSLSTSILSNDTENINPDTNLTVLNVSVPESSPVVSGQASSAAFSSVQPTSPANPAPKDSFHTMSPIALFPGTYENGSYGETVVEFSPVSKAGTQQKMEHYQVLTKSPAASKSSPLVKAPSPKTDEINLRVERVSTESVKPIQQSNAYFLVRDKILSDYKWVLVALLVFIFAGVLFQFSARSPAVPRRVETTPSPSPLHDGTSVTLHAPGDTNMNYFDDELSAMKRKPRRRMESSINIGDFDLYENNEDMAEYSEYLNHKKAKSDSKSPFEPRPSGIAALTVFKKSTFQMFAKSIQSPTMSRFAAILRELFERIKELNLLRRLDVFIRGIVLSVVNSGDGRLSTFNV